MLLPCSLRRVLNHKDSTHPLTPSFLQIHLNIVFAYKTKWSLSLYFRSSAYNFVRISRGVPACFLPRLFPSFRFSYLNVFANEYKGVILKNIIVKVQDRKELTSLYLLPLSCASLPSGVLVSPIHYRHCTLTTDAPCFSHKSARPQLHPLYLSEPVQATALCYRHLFCFSDKYINMTNVQFSDTVE
jgi:hypothetical protein